MNDMSMSFGQEPDPQMAKMLELVQQYIAEGMPKNEAMKKAMEMSQQGPTGMEPGMAPPMPQDNPMEEAAEGGQPLPAESMLQQIAAAKKAGRR